MGLISKAFKTSPEETGTRVLLKYTPCASAEAAVVEPSVINLPLDKIVLVGLTASKVVEDEVDILKIDLSQTALKECSELDNLLIRNVLIHKADGHLILSKNNRRLYLKSV